MRSLNARTVTLFFEAAQETREYLLAGAPLRRVEFRSGDVIRAADNLALTVQTVSERAGLLHYDCGSEQLCETNLSSTLSFSGPKERFFSSQFDPPKVFDLRLEALNHQHRRRSSAVRGFLGGRIDLLPHQLSIAAEVTGRLLPRVLLADEVGLGKTIEACLILHRLLLTGRARRILILVPESLVHQWFLELLRRFNLWFHIFDETRCEALEQTNPGTNPFLDDQLVLCDLGLFRGHAKRLDQALEAGWDLMVVDEAHHLGWSPEAASPDYGIVERLGRQIPGLLLLTATPEQLGMASHFARLRLLDPDRFVELEDFLRESAGYRELADLAEQLGSERALTSEAVTRLSRILETPEAELRAQLVQSEGATRKAWIEALLDQHGTGRVMFRNTRATIAGFPKRRAHVHALKIAHVKGFQTLAREWAEDSGSAESTPLVFAQDPRIEWLAGLLHNLGQAKVLLICRTQRKAEAIETALKQRLKVKMTVFHEGLTLVQRDRGAAWFAEPTGARLLICSEIGSEGRNFQFAQHLVLFDLPPDPALLEQRMGRLDRIGQTAEIQIHVPFVRHTHQEVLTRWYHEGLNAFEENLPGSRELRERFEPQLRELAQQVTPDQAGFEGLLQTLVTATRTARQEVAARLEQGRDRLLERNSFRPDTAARLIQEIRGHDDDHTLENFLLAVLDVFMINVESLAPRTYQLGSAGVLVDAFPGLPSEGLTITCDRSRALAREDLQFLTWDHPLVSGALDLLLSSEQGNSSFARWPDPKVSGFYLEAVYLLECIAPPHFHLDRFLPPTPLRVMVDHRGKNAGDVIPHDLLTKQLKPGHGRAFLEQPEIRETLLPRLIQQSQELADHKLGSLVAQARQTMNTQLDAELARLLALQKVNRSVRQEEIEAMLLQQRAMGQHIGKARLRLDALRLIHRGPLRG